MIGIIGKKLGMTQIFNAEGQEIPVTVIEAEPNPVVSVTDGATAGFAAVQLGLGQQRMAQLHAGRRDKLEISPNLWAGIGLVRGGAGTALVGDADTVAAGSRSMRMSESIRSSCRAIRIWRRPIDLRNWCSRTSPSVRATQSRSD